MDAQFGWCWLTSRSRLPSLGPATSTTAVSLRGWRISSAAQSVVVCAIGRPKLHRGREDAAMNGAKHQRRGTKGTGWDAWERGYEFREPPCQESGTRESVGTEGNGTGGNFESSLTTSLEFPIPHFPSPAPVGRPPFWLVWKDTVMSACRGETRHLPDSGISSIPRATRAASKDPGEPRRAGHLHGDVVGPKRIGQSAPRNDSTWSG
jgi:hypothetical protein